MKRLVFASLLFATALWFTDRVIAGFVQCDAARSCPNQLPELDALGANDAAPHAATLRAAPTPPNATRSRPLFSGARQ